MQTDKYLVQARSILFKKELKIQEFKTYTQTEGMECKRIVKKGGIEASKDSKVKNQNHH